MPPKIYFYVPIENRVLFLMIRYVLFPKKFYRNIVLFLHIEIFHYDTYHTSLMNSVHPKSTPSFCKTALYLMTIQNPTDTHLSMPKVKCHYGMHSSQIQCFSMILSSFFTSHKHWIIVVKVSNWHSILKKN